MKAIFRFFLTLFVLAGATTGCFTPPDYSPVPDITFNSMTKFEVIEPFSKTKQDSVVISIDFKDGDGDLGVAKDDRGDKRYTDWGNYQLRTFKYNRATKTFEEVILAANAKLFFPVLKPDLKRGPIEGILDYGIYFPYSRNARLTTVKFQIRVRDRALNQSNVVESDTISVPLL
jgi:hypothetical protein